MKSFYSKAIENVKLCNFLISYTEVLYICGNVDLQ